MRRAKAQLTILLPIGLIVIASAWLASLPGPAPVRAQDQICLLADFSPGVGTAQLIDRCLIIVKDTEPEDTGGDFDFDADLPADDIQDDFSFSLSDDQELQILVDGPGTYVITEDVPDGWEVDIDCELGEGVTFDEEDGVLTVTFTANTIEFAARCVFINFGPDDGVDEEFDDEEEDDDPTRTPTPTPTRTPFPTPVPTEVLAGNIGGVVGAIQPNVRAPAAAPPAAAPPAQAPTQTPAQIVRPPSTGDGGLAP
jgi:hypothetical protein